LGATPQAEKNHPPVYPIHHPKRHNWHTYTELLLLLVMYDKLARTYRISMWTSMHGPRCAKFSRGLA